jgi:hypothetical protein
LQTLYKFPSVEVNLEAFVDHVASGVYIQIHELAYAPCRYPCKETSARITARVIADSWITHKFLMIVRKSSYPCIGTCILISDATAYEDVDDGEYSEWRGSYTDGV